MEVDWRSQRRSKRRRRATRGAVFHLPAQEPIARESANVLLLGNDLLKVVEVIKIARRCHRIIMTNFAGTLGVDAAGVALAAFGFLNPVLAALIHVTSEMLFILNSARLLSRPAKASQPALSRAGMGTPATEQTAA